MSAPSHAPTRRPVPEPSCCKADVVGSLLRPPELLDARSRWLAGGLATWDYKEIEDRAVDGALALQERCGLDAVTDGEMRRMFFTGVVTDAIEGVELTPGQTTSWHGDENESEALDIQLPVAVTGKLRRRRSLATEEFAYARNRTDRVLKVTLPSPLMLSYFWSPEKSPSAYSDPFDLFADAAQIIHAEAQELASLGCRYIQLDAPELITLADPTQAAYFANLGIDPERMLAEGVDLINGCADVPGVEFAVHLCRGNNHGKWLAEGGYDAVSRKVFPRATNINAFALEYDSPRAGSFEALRDVPDDRRVILGLVSTKNDVVEDRGAMAARIDEAARHFPRAQLAVSTQCGFASEQSGNPLSETTQKAKLALVADLADSLRA
jgi:5-methyltetrahydropteroyltriglutamate--homocysteine methyltransferase